MSRNPVARTAHYGKIRVENLTKIFGNQPEQALKRIAEGKSEIFAETKQTVGVHDASFTVNEGEILVIMGRTSHTQFHKLSKIYSLA